MRKPIFIVGPHRSGSTLWHNLLAMSPQVLRLTDPRFIGRAGQRDFRYFLETQAKDLGTDAAVDELVELCFSRKAIPGLEGAFWRFEDVPVAADPQVRHEISRGIKASDRSLGAIARIVLSEVTRFSGYERACVKFPVDVTQLGVLFEWFPDCKVVHITRDPRALAASKSNDPSGTAMIVAEHRGVSWFVRKAALGMVIRQYRQAARVHSTFKDCLNYRLFQYEDLLVKPAEVAKDLFHFVELPYSKDILDLRKGRHDHQPSSLTGTRRRDFDPEAAVRWRRAMPAFDRWLVSLTTRSSMRRMGYHPNVHPVFHSVSFTGRASSAL